MPENIVCFNKDCDKPTNPKYSAYYFVVTAEKTMLRSNIYFCSNKHLNKFRKYNEDKLIKE